MMAKEFYRPQPIPGQQLKDRKERFAALNEFVRSRSGAWIVSVAGVAEVTLETLPDSAVPEDLRALGYDVREIGHGERILMHGIIERFTRRADGELEPLTAESTKAIAETRTHAGIVKTRRWSFTLA
jgi:hypothetical protein